MADLHPGPELDALVHKALRREGDPLPYSTDIGAASVAVEDFFRGGEAIQLGQDINGTWLTSLSHWTNGGEYGPRIWDNTGYRRSYRGLTAPHAVRLAVAGFFNDGPEWQVWGYDPMTDGIEHYDDSQEGT